jgi:hypothetical protein
MSWAHQRKNHPARIHTNSMIKFFVLDGLPS